MPSIPIYTPVWAIVSHSNNYGPRAKRWYHISRMIHADGMWFELYWHPSTDLRGDNKSDLRRTANARDLNLIAGVFHNKPPPRLGAEMQHEES